MWAAAKTLSSMPNILRALFIMALGASVFPVSAVPSIVRRIWGISPIYRFLRGMDSPFKYAIVDRLLIGAYDRYIRIGKSRSLRPEPDGRRDVFAGRMPKRMRIRIEHAQVFGEFARSRAASIASHSTWKYFASSGKSPPTNSSSYIMR